MWIWWRWGLRIALGAELAELSLPQGVSARSGDVTGTLAMARGIAVQARVNTETLSADGEVFGSSGTLTGFCPPTGPGIRVDTFGRPGLEIGTRYDSLLAKVIVHTRAADFGRAAARPPPLNGFAISGVDTNIAVLLSILSDEEFNSGPVTTSYLQRHPANPHVRHRRWARAPSSMPRRGRARAGAPDRSGRGGPGGRGNGVRR